MSRPSQGVGVKIAEIDLSWTVAVSLLVLQMELNVVVEPAAIVRTRVIDSTEWSNAFGDVQDNASFPVKAEPVPMAHVTSMSLALACKPPFVMRVTMPPTGATTDGHRPHIDGRDYLGPRVGRSRTRAGPEDDEILWVCYLARWRSRSAIASTVGWPAVTSITRS